jgi:hypothetical protein
MGQYLLNRKALGEIAIYGGSAFHFDWRKASCDVDARVTSDRSHGLVIEHTPQLSWDCLAPV